MGFDAQDKEIVRLLTKLKDADGKYPPDLLAARRQHYLKQMGQIGLGMGVGAGLKNVVKSGKAPALSSTTSTILESALVVAIVAETGTVAYFYRDKLAEAFQKITKESRVQEIAPSPVHTEQAIQGVTPSPALSSTHPSPTLSASPTAIELSSTPIPGVVEENNTISASSTPALNGNNGNHYGQTPKPQRTKEPKNNNNNDKAPKDDSKPPKDNSKPPKTK
jgi:hypothetical protein